MSAKIILVAIVALFSALSLYNYKASIQPHHQVQFKVWMEKYGKAYESEVQKAYRLSVWVQNYLYVQKHQMQVEQGIQTYELEMNQFADLTSDQFGSIYLMSTPNLKATSKCTGNQAPATTLEEADWSTKGAVTPIKNQGQCGSCWAFSAIGSLEGAGYQTTKTLTSFSEQQLVDCSHSYGNNGCGGGLMDFAFYYIIDNGITTQQKYPYKGVGGTCKYNAETDKAWTISDCTDVTEDKQSALVNAVAQQPVSVAIQANHLSFQLYKKGVYTGNCGTKLDHGVLAVGFGSTDGKKYFKVKNSWGPGWGQSGYILIERAGDGKGKCGINMAASFPIA